MPTRKTKLTKAEAGSLGGRARSPLKTRALRANLIKAREARLLKRLHLTANRER